MIYAGKEVIMSGSNKDLFEYAQWNWTEGVCELLKENHTLDVLYKEGQIFGFAVEKNNVEMVTALLEYYKLHQLKVDRGSVEYLNNLDALYAAMDKVESSYEIGNKVREVLSEYLFDGREQQKLAEIDAMIEHQGASGEQNYAATPAENFAGWPAELSYGAMHNTLSGNHHEVEAQ